MSDADGGDLALVRRFPALAQLPRASLGVFPTPVERAPALAPDLWIKRDDLTAQPFGGNKIRALEFLLAGVNPGDRVVTAGAYGSTHALATAIHARRLGARVELFLWPQEMNDTAVRVRERNHAAADVVREVRSVPAAYLRGLAAGLRGARWIPPGGSTALGSFGYANAALELAAQVHAGLLPAPARIVVPLGSGGTTAGLLAGLALTDLPTTIVAARVVPRVVANRWHVLRLARGATRLLRRLTGEPLPLPTGARLRIVHDVFGGAYGREIDRARAAAERCRSSSGIALDPTYSAKAFAAALAAVGAGPTLFWLTFDRRVLDDATP